MHIQHFLNTSQCTPWQQASVHTKTKVTKTFLITTGKPNCICLTVHTSPKSTATTIDKTSRVSSCNDQNGNKTFVICDNYSAVMQQTTHKDMYQGTNIKAGTAKFHSKFWSLGRNITDTVFRLFKVLVPSGHVLWRRSELAPQHEIYRYNRSGIERNYAVESQNLIFFMTHYKQDTLISHWLPCM